MSIQCSSPCCRREIVGLGRLCYNGKLIAAAIRHSSDMNNNQFTSLIGSDGSTMASRASDEEYIYFSLAQNVFSGKRDVQSIMNAVSSEFFVKMKRRY